MDSHDFLGRWLGWHQTPSEVVNGPFWGFGLLVILTNRTGTTFECLAWLLQDQWGGAHGLLYVRVECEEVLVFRFEVRIGCDPNSKEDLSLEDILCIDCGNGVVVMRTEKMNSSRNFIYFDL